MNSKNFDIKNLKVTFNKKINIENIFYSLKKKLSINETIIYIFCGYYKFKKNVLLFCFTNEKIFIESEKNNLFFNGIYTYKELENIELIEKQGRFFFHSYLKITIKNLKIFKIKGIDPNNYNVIIQSFLEQRKKYFQIINLSHFKKKGNYIENKEALNKETVEKEEVKEEVKGKIIKKKVINDDIISDNNTFSSLYLYNLLTKKNTRLPNDKETLITKITENNVILNEKIKLLDFQIDKKNNLNTLPVLVEVNSEYSELENKLVFTKNWIEYTKHNVKNKFLGVDNEGNGQYFDLDRLQEKNELIDVFKGREYKIKGKTRNGIRSSQIVPFYTKNNKIGLNDFYFNKNTNEKLDIKRYDGIIFLGIKYYFDVYNEFSKLQKQYLKIFVEDKNSYNKSIRKYELIFEENLLSYKAINEKNQIVDDEYIHADDFDLKWLTFFKN